MLNAAEHQKLQLADYSVGTTPLTGNCLVNSQVAEAEKYYHMSCIFISNININDLFLQILNTQLCVFEHFYSQGPVVQSAVSLTSSLVVKMLTVLVSTISNSYVFLLKKCE